MSRLPPGIYHIRYTPTVPPPPGGSYATSEGFNAQVTAKALRPPFQQQWVVVPFSTPEPNSYTIIHNSTTGPRIGWALGGGEFPNHTRVSLLPNFRHWIIREANPGSNIYHITEPSPVLEVTKAVDVNDELLFVNSFLLGVPLPRWEFIRVANVEE